MKRKSLPLRRIIFLILIVIIPVQGCVVYTRPVELEKAINKGPVKVYTTDGKIYKFKSLNQDGDHVNGLNKVRNEVITRSILKNEIVRVKLENVILSDLLTTASIMGGTCVLVGLSIAGLSELYHQDK